MSILWTISDLSQNPKNFIEKALDKELFIYPTDTIYGIGWIVCESVISKISTWKNRPASKFYSIIAPSFERIDEHFERKTSSQEIWEKFTTMIEKPGLTVILKHKKNTWFPFELLSPNWTVWVRIINHPLQKLVAELWQPFITTSCNKSWETPIWSIDQIHEPFDWIIIDWGTLNGSWSAIFDGESWERVR